MRSEAILDHDRTSFVHREHPRRIPRLHRDPC
jgi:hypothetical protein